MDFEDAVAVFEGVLTAMNIARQSAFLAQRHEATAKPIGKGAPQREAASLDADHHGRVLGAHGISPGAHRDAERDGIGQDPG